MILPPSRDCSFNSSTSFRSSELSFFGMVTLTFTWWLPRWLLALASATGRRAWRAAEWYRLCACWHFQVDETVHRCYLDCDPRMASKYETCRKQQVRFNACAHE